MSAKDKQSVYGRFFDRHPLPIPSTANSLNTVQVTLIAGDEIRSNPPQRIVSMVESNRFGTIYLTQIIPDATSPSSTEVEVQSLLNSRYSDELLEETVEIDQSLLNPEQELQEFWVSNQLSQDQQDPDELIFQLREERVEIWNRILPSSAQFSSLTVKQQFDALDTPFRRNLYRTLSLSTELDLDLDDFEQTSPSHPSPDEKLNEILSGGWTTTPSVKISFTHLPSPIKHSFKEERGPEMSTLSELLDSSGSLSKNIVKTVSFKDVKASLESVLPLLEFISKLHVEGYCLGGFDPSLFRLVEEGKHQLIKPIYPLKLFSSISAQDRPINVAQAPCVSGEETSLYTGFSSPEMYGYFEGVPTPQSDVFSGGMLLYYLVTGCPRLSETRRPFSKLPSPVVYRQDLPPELVSVICKSISPVASRRQVDMPALIDDLKWALRTIELRESYPVKSLSLDAGHEIHVGLLKGQYNPVNQDDLFLGYQVEQDLGLFVVTDGVSICEYGSGDLASSLVREQAVECWRDLSQPVQVEEEEDTLSEVNMDQISAFSGGYGKVLESLINKANQRIGDYVNTSLPPMYGPAEGVMAATIVAGIINQGVATLTSVGDSRIYLIREGHISSLMYDEDLFTHLLQAKQTPSQAQQSPSAAALVHCVGEFSKNEENKLVPVQIQPQLRELKLLPGDTLLFCSDGIPDYSGLDEEDSEELMREVVENALTVHHAAFELVSLANRGGGGDNLSCIVIQFYSNDLQEELK